MAMTSLPFHTGLGLLLPGNHFESSHLLIRQKKCIHFFE